MGINNETYSKHRYEINIVECAYEVVQRMKAVKKRPKNQISVEEYAIRLREAIQAYKWSIDFDTSASEVARKRACVISPTHPAFDFWLALHLSVEEVDEIPMLLDAYLNGEFGEIDNFLGHVQYFVLKIMKKNVFFDFEAQKQEVISWVREKRAALKKSEADEKPPFNINIEQLNFVKNETSIDIQITNQLTFLLQQFNFQQFNEFVNIYQETTKETINPEGDEVENEVQTNLHEPNTDRIPVTLKYPEVLDYFMKLIKHKDNEHLKKKDIENLVKANFEFRGTKPSGKKKHLEIKIKKQYLTRFVYIFYKEIDPDFYDEKTTLYCQFLIDNFSNYKSDKLVNLKKNFSRDTTGRYPFTK